MTLSHRRWLLARYPSGVPTDDTFRLGSEN